MRCSQRCSQQALVLKTTTPQVVDLRRHVELEGIEPSTSSMPSMVRTDQQSSRKGLQAAVRMCHPRGGTTEFNFSLAPRDDVCLAGTPVSVWWCAFCAMKCATCRAGQKGYQTASLLLIESATVGDCYPLLVGQGRVNDGCRAWFLDDGRHASGRLGR